MFAAAIAAITASWIPGVLNFEVGADFPFFVRRTRRMTLRMRNGIWLEWPAHYPGMPLSISVLVGNFFTNINRRSIASPGL
jgi:hypothetical protein